ncbi:MAG: tetratricopeptide repeat protein [Myxococcota bacterium]
MPTSLLNRALTVLLPAAVAFIAYWSTLGHQMVWDDTTLLRPDVLAKAWGPLPFSVNYFRPLGVWSLAVEANIWQGDPAGHHLGNAALHAINTGLVAALLRGLIDRDGPGWKAAILALVFGLHPVLVEGIVFISSRFDLLLTAGLLLALLAESRLSGLLRPLAIGGAFLLAAMSKETAAGFPLILLTFQLAHGISPRQRWRSYLAVVIGGLLYLGMRASALDALFTPGLTDVIDAGNPLQHLLLIGRSFETYLLLIVWPFGNLTPIHYADLPLSTASRASWRSLIVMVAAIVGVIALIRRNPAAGWMFTAAFAALAPAMNLVPLQLTGGAFVAERYLVLPLVFFVLGLSATVSPWLRWTPDRAPIAITAIGVWAAAALVTIQSVSTHWYSQQTLWRWGLEVAPKSSLPAVNLSERLNASGRPEEGLAMAQEALRRNNQAPMAWNNQGQAMFLLGRYADAAKSFEKATQLEPKTAFFWSNLGASYMEMGDLQAAEATLLNKALPLDPGNPDAVLNLAGVYLKAGRLDKAKEQIDAVLLTQDHPRALSLQQQVRDPRGWIQLADFLRSQKDFTGAQAALDQARALGGAPVDIAVSWSSILIEAGSPAQAASVIRQALPVAPEDPRLPYNMGVAALNDNAVAEARVWFSRAATIAPDWPPPRERLDALQTAQP